MSKKLLYVINHMDWFWSHRLPLARGAQDAGWEVSVAATHADTDEKLREMGFKGCGLPSTENGLAVMALIGVIFRLHKIIKTARPDLLHAVTLKYAFLAGMVSRLHREVAVVHTIAGLGYLFSGEGFKPCLLRALVTPLMKFAFGHPNSRLIFQNSNDRQIFIQRGMVREGNAVLIRSSGVDVASFTEMPEPDGEPVVIMSSRLVHDKGIAVFVEAARLVDKRGIKAKYKLAGGLVTNNPAAVTQADIDEMVADNVVEWMGRVTDMPRFYAESHLMVYPSYYREGVPKVLLEAAATGRAIITTDHPGCREAVVDGKNGLLVPVKDALATANAIEMLLKDNERRRAMGRASRKLAEQVFDVKIIVAETLAVYQQVCPIVIAANT